jgi:hypothetical protein
MCNDATHDYENGDTPEPAPTGAIAQLMELKKAAEAKFEAAKEAYAEDKTDAKNTAKKVAKARFDALKEAYELFVTEVKEEIPQPQPMPAEEPPAPGYY